VRIALAFLIALVAGCGSGPDSATLRADVIERLAQAFPPKTITLVDLQRRGSQSDAKAPGGETRRTIYFDVAIKLERDLDLGAWNAPGVASLVSLLGAGPKGVTGLAAGGNKSGDVLRAHATALYKRDGDGWTQVVARGYVPGVAPAYATNAPPDRTMATLETIRKAITSLPTNFAPGERAAIEEELAVATAAIKARLARAADGYAIAAGPEHGQYLRFARALATRDGLRLVPLITHGGDENLRLLREGKVNFALAQGDAALDAYRGTGEFSGEGAYSTVRAIGSLYPEPVHVIVHAKSRFDSISDLRGRRIAVGERGAAARTTAFRVLQAHGLGPKDVKTHDMGIGSALTALRENEVDAAVYVIGMPADVIRSALEIVPLRFLPLSERAVATLTADNLAYFKHTIPRGVYGTRDDVRTIGTAALLLGGVNLTDSEVRLLTRFVFDRSADLVARGSAQGAQVSAAMAREGLGIPLHRAAEQVLQDLKGVAPQR
jgi:TRAP transporter TAXI family solute receptor